MSEIRVFQSQLISTKLLFQHPMNPQVQSEFTFNELRESIRNGFDEPLIGYPRQDGVGYWIISGNHRKQAAELEGVTELPVIIRDDWTPLQADLEVVKRNYTRGHLDNTKFTEFVNHISQSYNVAIEDLIEELGFKTPDDFAKFYESENLDDIKAEIDKSTNVSILDDLASVVQSLIEEYGETIPNGFIIFPLGGNKHTLVETSPSLKKLIKSIASKCVKEGITMEVALAGLLKVGMDTTSFGKKDADIDLIVKHSSE